ncbi:MAG: flagellar export protein FliJ [Syntrophomonadaceae bacterium]|nr:flagellar export protein FliJ [Syntrophomonadaceae bacterium]
MRNFTFRLQTPFNVVTWKEKLAKQEFKEKQTAYDREVEILCCNSQDLSDLSDQEREFMGCSVSAENMVALKEYQVVLANRVRSQQVVVDQTYLVLEETRLHLSQTVKEKKTLEKLKDKRYEQFRQECIRQDQKVIDEAAVIGFNREQKS